MNYAENTRYVTSIKNSHTTNDVHVNLPTPTTQ